MKPSLSQFATYADYMSACSSDKSAVVAHYAAEEAKAAEEAQQAKDAALWRKVIAMDMYDLYRIADDCVSMAEFIEAINEQ